MYLTYECNMHQIFFFFFFSIASHLNFPYIMLRCEAPVIVIIDD